MVMGLLVSCYLAYCLFTFPVEAKITGYHIAYEQHFPAALSKYVELFYIRATIVPRFLSSIRNMWLLGTAILVSYIITTIFYEDYVVSVWCFFASNISISVFVIMHEILLFFIEQRKQEYPTSLLLKINTVNNHIGLSFISFRLVSILFFTIFFTIIRPYSWLILPADSGSKDWLWAEYNNSGPLLRL